MKCRIGVLVSGMGTNLQALLEAARAGTFEGEVVIVISNVPGAGALARAAAFGVPTVVVDHRDFPDRASFEGELLRHLAGKGVELVVLAGFLRLLSPRFIDAFPGRIINVHPSLLPAFPGLHAPRQALRHGVRYTGCTVHFVDEGCDTGPIILQAPVPVVAGDDEASLAARIRKAEHRLLPEAIRLFIEGRLVVEGRRVRILAEGKGRGNTEKRRESA